MSSKSKSKSCSKCHEVETLPTRPLVRCTGCKRHWHDCCHTPRIADTNGGNFICKKCGSKKVAGASSGSTPVTATTTPTLSTTYTAPPRNTESPIPANNLCKINGCRELIPGKGQSESGLCRMHEVGHRFSATAKSSSVACKTAQPSTSVRKDKYKVRPHEDSGSLKRKRHSAGIRNPAEAVSSRIRDDNGAAQPSIQDMGNIVSIEPPSTPQSKSGSAQKARSQPPRNAETSLPDASRVCKHLYTKAAVDKALQDSIAKDRGFAKSISGSTTDYTKTRKVIKRCLEKLAQREPSASHLAEDHRLRGPASPTIFSPDNSIPCAEAELYDEGWVRSYLAKEVEALCHLRFPEVPVETPSSVASPSSLPPPKAMPISEVQQPSGARMSRTQFSKASEPKPPIPGSKDQKLHDASLLTVTTTTSSAGDSSGKVTVDAALRDMLRPSLPLITKATPSAQPTKIAAGTQKNLDITFASSATQTDLGVEPISSKTVRESSQDTTPSSQALYDESILDSYITKQMNADPDAPVSAQELAKTQLWGYIDPRKVWPSEPSDDWLEEKRKEIDARGGRKANFGKILTPRVRKERLDNGWGIHQTKNAVQDECTAEQARHLEELFGLRDIGNFVPEVRDGELVMVEQMVDDNGRKRKATLKVLPVGR